MRQLSFVLCRAALTTALLASGCASNVSPMLDATSDHARDAIADANSPAMDASMDHSVTADAGCQQDRDCPMGLPRCDAASGRCVACTLDAQCAAGMRCLDFVCQTRCGAGPACTGAARACCNDACVATDTDPNHCGACGHRCPTAEWCVLGRCVGEDPCSQCTASQSCCSGECVDVRSNSANCGACGRVCLSGQGCFNGTCTGCGPCPAGHSCCDGRCVNLASDRDNCGMCGLSCGDAGVCSMARCL